MTKIICDYCGRKVKDVFFKEALCDKCYKKKTYPRAKEEEGNKDQKAFANHWNKNIDYACDKNDPFTALNQGADCCKNKHQTFYGAIVKSPQWHKWYEEQMKRFSELTNDKTKVAKPTFDIDESEGCGVISDGHIQEFFKFIKEDK